MENTARTPEVATPRAVAATTGFLYLLGATAVLCVVLAGAARGWSGTVLAAVVVVAAAVGAGCLWRGRFLPRWTWHVLVGGGTGLITTVVLAAPDTASSVALAGIYAFVALDAFFFFAPRPALLHLGAALTAGSLALAARPGLDAGAVAAQDVVLVGVAAVVGALVRRASSASRDSLTGLLNRRGFGDALRAAVPDAARGRGLSVVLLDLDHFKAVNDTGGHAAGDDLLRAVTTAWRALVPAGALLGRYGGDEFAVLLPGHDGAAALALAERLRLAAAPAGVSVGVAQLRPGESGADLVRRADVALYEAKDAGRGRCALAGDGDVALAHDLALALERGEVRVHYQPVVALPGAQVLGVEALVRWDRPGHGPVPPLELVRAAERHGLVGALGAHVVRRACEDAVALRAAAGRDLFVTVNASGRELTAPGYADGLAAALRAAGLPPAALVVEVTETLLEAESASALAALEQVRALGVAVAVDDFGTGWSSLHRLDVLPVSHLKLDRSFVRDLASCPQRVRLLRGVVALAEALALRLVAEGVETAEQRDVLLALGCPLAQGYLFGRPAPLAEVLAAVGAVAAGPVSSRT
ncbi:putative bifunctional diguanylate cyclase/phosphodiesterase [Kineococcus terrestris]|uniref:putative bifunctional diguanylate cyclase/phosphodiesterase n=1 Tax=Kineococcus terrestris TaxID=2044856 RepID=UPI0034DB09C3